MVVESFLKQCQNETKLKVEMLKIKYYNNAFSGSSNIPGNQGPLTVTGWDRGRVCNGIERPCIEMRIV